MKTFSSSCNYLIKNPYSYCFRLRVPLDLQRFIGKTELRYSLKTGKSRIAKSKARILAGKIQLLFEELRKGNTGFMKLSEEQIKELIEKYVKAELRNLGERVFENPLDSDYPPAYIDKDTMYSQRGMLDTRI
jgi:hypothetical protein